MKRSIEEVVTPDSPENESEGDQLPKRQRREHSKIKARKPGLMSLPFEILVMIFLWAGTSLDELALEFFRRRSDDEKIVGQRAQLKILSQNLLDQTYPMARLNLLIHWWKIPRHIFDNLIVWSTQRNQVQCLRMLMKFWDLHLCCKTSKCAHVIPHKCYRPGQVNYPMVKAMSCPILPIDCVFFFIREYGFQIDNEAYWLRILLDPRYFPFLQALYAEFPTIGKRNLSILLNPNIFVVPTRYDWEIRVYVGVTGRFVGTKYQFLNYANRETKELHFIKVQNWLKTIGLGARRREHVL